MREFTVKAVHDGGALPGFNQIIDGWDIIDPWGFTFEFCDEEHIADELAEAYTKAYALGWNDAVEQGSDTFIPSQDGMEADYEKAVSYK